jgi:molybdopterin molybdotransferase
VAELISIDEARARVLAEVRPLEAEPVPLADCLGRVLAEDVSAAEDIPPFDASAMDGYAARAGAGGELPVVDESRAGRPAARPPAAGEAIRISTGALVPEGDLGVVPVERVEELGDRVRLPEVKAGANVRRAGEDVREGELVLIAGTPLGPAEVAVMASLGHPEARCARRPRVAVLATGDELVEPGQPLGPGQIRNSNGFALNAQASRAGAAGVLAERVPDDYDATLAALARALDAADVTCVSGGVSVGPHDHVKGALEELGVEERFWGVALKPGKPTWFGARGDRLVFGLPGNPVSAMVTFQLFALPALRKLAGADPAGRSAEATLDVSVRLSPARAQAIRCRLRADGDGWHVEPTKEQNSHILTSMLGAGALAFVPPGEGELAPGTRLAIELLD